MQRMTDVLSRMLNDPATRAALSSAGDDSIENVIDQQSIINRTVNNEEAINQDISNNQIEMNNSAEQELASTSAESNNTEEVNANTSENAQLEVNENVDQENLTQESSNSDELPVPMDIESNDSGERSAEELSMIYSEPQSQPSNEQNVHETESPNVESNSSNSNNMMENLQDRLTTMRDGFLERYKLSILNILKNYLIDSFSCELLPIYRG